MEEKRTTYTIYEGGEVGEVEINDDVIAVIAAVAAMEVEGVASMAGNITADIVAKLGMKKLSKQHGYRLIIKPGIWNKYFRSF